MLTDIDIDKVMKPYWDFKFDSCILKKLYTLSNPWYGIGHNDDHIIVGCPLIDVEEGTWFYNSGYFEGGEDMFSFSSRNDFLDAMKRYLNEKYSLNIESII